jgi:hypothetical protein
MASRDVTQDWSHLECPPLRSQPCLRLRSYKRSCDVDNDKIPQDLIIRSSEEQGA